MLGTIGNIASIAGFIQQNSELIGKATKIFVSKDEEIKNEVAIAIDISRPCVTTVEKFLKEEGIDANILTVKAKDQKRKLDSQNRREWEDVLNDFSNLIESVYEEVSPERLHIFIAAPASLAFGMGSIIGTLYNPYIYNYNRNTGKYDLVLSDIENLRY